MFRREGRGATGRFVFCTVVLCITCLISIYMYVLGYGYIHSAEAVKSMEYSVTFPAKTSDTLWRIKMGLCGTGAKVNKRLVFHSCRLFRPELFHIRGPAPPDDKWFARFIRWTKFAIANHLLYYEGDCLVSIAHIFHIAEGVLGGEAIEEPLISSEKNHVFSFIHLKNHLEP